MYYMRSAKNDGILMNFFGILLPTLLCSELTNLPVFAIVLTQFIETAADSFAFYAASGQGWGQPDALTSSAYYWANDLVTLSDSLGMYS
jgi:hypothetical protein